MLPLVVFETQQTFYSQGKVISIVLIEELGNFLSVLITYFEDINRSCQERKEKVCQTVFKPNKTVLQ